MTTTTQVFVGLGAAPGRATGPAHVLRGHSAALHVPAGSILVVRVLNPYLAPVLLRVKGVVVEEGGLLQHATRLAREFGIPAVVGLLGATDLFDDGEEIEVRGDTGEVVRRAVEGRDAVSSNRPRRSRPVRPVEPDGPRADSPGAGS